MALYKFRIIIIIIITRVDTGAETDQLVRGDFKSVGHFIENAIGQLSGNGQIHGRNPVADVRADLLHDEVSHESSWKIRHRGTWLSNGRQQFLNRPHHVDSSKREIWLGHWEQTPVAWLGFNSTFTPFQFHFIFLNFNVSFWKLSV